MNLIFLLISITSFLDAYYEDENAVMKVSKYILAFFSIFPIIQDITYGLRRPEVLPKLIVRRTVEYIFPNFWENLYNKDCNAFENILSEYFLCSDINGGLNYRFIEGYFLHDDYERLSNKYDYDDIKTMQANELYSFTDLGHKDNINFTYNGQKYRCRLKNTNPDQVLHIFKLNNGNFINFVDHESEWIYYYGISKFNFGFDFLNSPHIYKRAQKRNRFMVDLYHRCDPLDKIAFLRERLGNTKECATVDMNTENEIVLNEIKEDEYDIDLFEIDGNMGWVM
ncbi:MAG: hypothetical protein EXX96DRAFT_612215 [Benjaminiella poitrasii]|nr:MAG: hypothetical protein EXX96DRAFT_612215 [Benjaminiella poitrasii]